MRSIERLVTNIPRRVKTVIGVIIAAIILVPLGWQLYAHWDEVGPYLVQVDLGVLLIALSLAVIDLGILAFAWLLIVNRLEIALGSVQDLRAFFFSNFAKRVPGMIWYVLGRAYMYRAEDGGMWMATTATVLENAFLFLTGLLLALGLWPQYLGLDSAWIVVALLVVLVVVLLLSLYPTVILRFARLFRRRAEASQIRPVHLSSRDVLLWMVLYGLVWLVGGLSFYGFVAAFYPSLSFASLPQVVGVSTVYSLSGFVAFFIPAGMGVKELAGAYLLSRVIPSYLSVAIVLLFRLHLLLAEGFWLALSHSLELSRAMREV
jgi:hypothetical protein